MSKSPEYRICCDERCIGYTLYTPQVKSGWRFWWRNLSFETPSMDQARRTLELHWGKHPGFALGVSFVKIYKDTDK
jgi:hypothetical protein